MNAIKAILMPQRLEKANEHPLKTYGMNFEKRCIEGFCDDVDALKQYIYKALRTRRFAFLIYDADYGSEIESVRQAGHLNSALLVSELEFAVREALMPNEHIQNVGDFSYSVEGDKVKLSFVVDSTFGSLTMREVF